MPEQDAYFSRCLKRRRDGVTRPVTCLRDKRASSRENSFRPLLLSREIRTSSRDIPSRRQTTRAWPLGFAHVSGHDLHVLLMIVPIRVATLLHDE